MSSVDCHLYMVTERVTPYTQKLRDHLQSKYPTCQMYHPDHLIDVHFEPNDIHAFVYVQAPEGTSYAPKFSEILKKKNIMAHSGVAYMFEGEVDTAQLPDNSLPLLHLSAQLGVDVIHMKLEKLCWLLREKHQLQYTIKDKPGPSPQLKAQRREFLQRLETTLHHEIRNALTPIYMGGQLLQQRKDQFPETIQSTLDEMVEAGRSIKSTLNQLGVVLYSQLEQPEDYRKSA